LTPTAIAVMFDNPSIILGVVTLFEECTRIPGGTPQNHTVPSFFRAAEKFPEPSIARTSLNGIKPATSAVVVMELFAAFTSGIALDALKVAASVVPMGTLSFTLT